MRNIPIGRKLENNHLRVRNGNTQAAITNRPLLSWVDLAIPLPDRWPQPILLRNG